MGTVKKPVKKIKPGVVFFIRFMYNKSIITCLRSSGG